MSYETRTSRSESSIGANWDISDTDTGIMSAAIGMNDIAQPQ
jgi:hypothetical protein